MRERQLNSSNHPMPFLLVLSSDHLTGASGITPIVTISKDGGAFGSPAGAVSEIANGWYALAGNATDRNTLGSFVLHASGVGTDTVDTQYDIVGYDPYSSTNLGLTNLDTNVGSRSAPATAQTIDLTVAVPTTGNTANTIGDCLNAGRAQGFGKWVLNRSTNVLTLYAPDGTTTVRSFQLDSSTAPSQRV